MEIVKTIKRIEKLTNVINKCDSVECSDAAFDKMYNAIDKRKELIKSLTVGVRIRRQLRLALKLLVRRNEISKRTADIIY